MKSNDKNMVIFINVGHLWGATSFFLPIRRAGGQAQGQRTDDLRDFAVHPFDVDDHAEEEIEEQQHAEIEDQIDLAVMVRSNRTSVLSPIQKPCPLDME